MENSIKEDINRCNKLTANWIGLSNQLALKRILSDYKKVLKENEQLRTEVNSLKEDIFKSNMYDEEVINYKR